MTPKQPTAPAPLAPVIKARQPAPERAGFAPVGAAQALTPRRRAQARIIAPVAGQLRRAGALSVLGGVLWPLQAGLIAWVIGGWAQGNTSGGAGIALALWAGLGFVVLAMLRAGLEHRAGAILFDAADRVIARERAALIAREAAAAGPVGSAGAGALAVQKLQALQPWITRYHLAMVRVSILPPLLLVIALWHSWSVALILLVAGPLIPVFMALVGMAAEDAARRQMYEIGALNDMLMDRLAALLDVRLLGAGARMAQDFQTRAEALRDKTMAVLRIAFLSSTVLELFAAIGVAMVAVFIGFHLLGELNFGSWGSPLSLAEGVFLLLIVPEFFQPLRDLAAAWHDRAAGFALVAELETLEEAPRIPALGRGVAHAPLPGPLSVDLSGAHVRYGAQALHMPDLQLRAGQGLAVTGPSGAGKSTLLAVLGGMMALSGGHMRVCGHDLNDDTADAWRARLAVLPQHPHFGDQSLRDFLDPRGSGADPAHALALAGASDVVVRLPDGLDTRLGETGGGVSGGEARRLMLARAVLAGGDLILADEPTADLDPWTAKRVIAALIQLKAQGRALVVATHDPALIAAMERRVELRA